MLSKSDLKFLQSLKQKKYRQQHDVFVAEGEKVVEALLNSDYCIEGIYATEDWLMKYKHSIKRPEFKITEITEAVLGKISSLTTPNKVVAVARQQRQAIAYNNMANELMLLLDQINDPGNLGTIIRIASWFNIKHIVCSENTVDLYNSKTIQATMGALFNLSICYGNSTEFLNTYKKITGNKIYAATINGSDLFKKHLTSHGAIIIGNESHGISEAILKLVDAEISIPSFNTTASIDSLNAAVSTGIIVAEFRRRSDYGL